MKSAALSNTKKEVMFWLISGLILSLCSLYSYLLFHSLVELFTVVVASCIFVIVWNTRKFIDNNYLVFVGVSFFFVAFLDSIHLLVYHGMTVFPDAVANHATQLWISARFLQSFSFLLALYYLERSLEFDILYVCYCIVTTLLLTAVIYDIFPDCFIEGQGLTIFKKVSEWVIVSIFAISMYFLKLKKDFFDGTMYRLLTLSLAASVASELFFTSYASVYGGPNLVGHLFKLVSYILIYKAIIETGLLKPYDVMFRNLKQNEENLQKNEARLNEAQRISKVGHWTLDIVHDRLTCSSEFLRIFGWSDLVPEAGYSAFLETVHPEDRERVDQAYKRSLKNRTIFDCGHRLLLHDGSVKYVKEKCETFYGENGQPLQSLGIVQDITREKEVERALKESQDFLEKIVENIPDMISVKDAKELRYVRFNKAGEDLLGIGREELLGRSDYECFPGENADYSNEKDRAAISGKRLLDIPEEKIQTRKKGTRILQTKKIPILNSSGEAEYLLNISEDITDRLFAEEERKRMTRQLQQAQKMEAIGTLAGGIAHDFNNILHIILGYSGLAKMDIPSGLEAAHKEVDQIIIAAEKARSLVRQILTFSRQSEGELQLLNPSSIVKEALKLLRSSLPVTIEIEREIDDECGIIWADPTQIHQVLMNLCTNAYHSMEKTGGVLTVVLDQYDFSEANRKSVSDVKPGRYLRMKVSDTGTGIAPENRNKIFDPFFTTKEQGKGTGLGLSIIHGIIKKYNGSIQMESQEGVGTTFTILLPIVHEEVSDDKGLVQSIPRGKERILIVDDEDSVAELSKNMLERIGYSVTTRYKSPEALEDIRKDPGRFDLIVTDQTMPGLTGAQFAEEVLRIRPDMPIVLCTGFSNQISEEKAKEIGIRGFAMKPFVLEDFAKLIRKVLDE